MIRELILVAIFAGFVALVHSLDWLWSPAEVGVPRSVPLELDYTLHGPYHTEEEYIVGSVCRNAYEMISYIADRKGEEINPQLVRVKKIVGPDVAYEVTLASARGPVDATLRFPTSIWSSSSYVPFCQAAMATLQVAKPVVKPDSQGNPIATLLDFDEKSIEAENQRVSQWLATEPDNVLAQQQAAFVLGVLALKENSGWFWDPRDMCNHLAAHLAVARALSSGGDLALEGQLAELFRGLIDDTKKECGDEMDHLAQLHSPPTELAAWLRAGRMRNTRDWRIVSDPESATPVEQVEFIRAYSEAVSTDQASDWLDRHQSMPQRQDFTRIIIECGFSVEDGHKYTMPAIAKELELMRSVFPDRFQRKSLVADLNAPPRDILVADATGKVVPRVINRGMWARYFPRLLCEDVAETGYFLDSLWGVPDQAAAFDYKAQVALSQLELFPYTQQLSARLRNRSLDMRAAVYDFTQHPEWAPFWIHRLPSYPRIIPNQFQSLLRDWFSPTLPSGTAYDAFNRVSDAMKSDPAVMDKLFAIAPLQYAVADGELTAHYPEPTYDQAVKVMGPLADYYLDATDRVASAQGVTPAARIAIEQKAAAIDPERLWNLAEDLVKSGQNDAAAEAYQQWFDKGTDRVAVSNDMDWLVNYYCDHGEQDKAMTIAQNCAEVYSERGLETMLKLQERLGNLDDAENYGSQIKDRYGDSGPLIAFYKREVDKGNAGYKSKLDESVTEIFPDGLQNVTLSSFTAVPSAGIQFAQTNGDMERWGLSSDQIVVALDGYRVGNVSQYTLVRSFTSSPQMTFIVWDGSMYREIKATQPNRRFGVDLNNYQR